MNEPDPKPDLATLLSRLEIPTITETEVDGNAPGWSADRDTDDMTMDEMMAARVVAVDLTKPITVRNPIARRLIRPERINPAYLSIQSDALAIRASLGTLDPTDPRYPELRDLLVGAIPSLANPEYEFSLAELDSAETHTIRDEREATRPKEIPTEDLPLKDRVYEDYSQAAGSPLLLTAGPIIGLLVAAAGVLLGLLGGARGGIWVIPGSLTYPVTLLLVFSGLGLIGGGLSAGLSEGPQAADRLEALARQLAQARKRFEERWRDLTGTAPAVADASPNGGGSPILRDLNPKAAPDPATEPESIRDSLIERLQLPIPVAFGGTGEPEAAPGPGYTTGSNRSGRAAINLTEPVETMNPVFRRLVNPRAARSGYARMLDDAKHMREGLLALDADDPSLPALEQRMIAEIPSLAHAPRRHRLEDEFAGRTQHADWTESTLPFRDTAFLRFDRTEDSANSNYLMTLIGIASAILGICMFAVRMTVPLTWISIGMLVVCGLLLLIARAGAIIGIAAVGIVGMNFLAETDSMTPVGLGLATIGLLALIWSATRSITVARRRIASLAELVAQVHEARTVLDRMVAEARAAEAPDPQTA